MSRITSKFTESSPLSTPTTSQYSALNNATSNADEEKNAATPTPKSEPEYRIPNENKPGYEWKCLRDRQDGARAVRLLSRNVFNIDQKLSYFNLVDKFITGIAAIAVSSLNVIGLTQDNSLYVKISTGISCSSAVILLVTSLRVSHLKSERSLSTQQIDRISKRFDFDGNAFVIETGVSQSLGETADDKIQTTQIINTGSRIVTLYPSKRT